MQPPRRLFIVGALLLGTGAAAAIARRLRPLDLPLDMPPARRHLGTRIPFDGLGNLRDLGGYATADGRTVRWGALYRSDHLGALSARDLRNFRRLGLVTLVDFRSTAEKADAPDRLPRGHAINVVELPLFDDDASSNLGAYLRARLERGELDDIDPAALLTDANERMVTAFTPSYRTFIGELLAARGAPVLFHCTAGKDRTGFAAAIVLRLLGVPEEHVVADYLRSKQYSLAARRRELVLLRLLKGPRLTGLVRALLGVEAAYLQAAFAAIDREYGSFAAYARDGLGLDSGAIERLRSYLLEP
jgi:protein-tyrosine phosphatase